MDTLITIGTQEYRVGKLSPMKQFHVARRIAPLLAALGGAALSAPKDIAAIEQSDASADDAAEDSALGAIQHFLQSLAPALASMSDEESEYIINTCLAVVKRKQNTSFAPVIASNGRLMFEDIALPDMMQLTVAVIQENLGSFFPDAPGKSSSSEAPAT